MRRSGWLVLALLIMWVGITPATRSGGAQQGPSSPGIVDTPADVMVEYVGDTEPADAPGTTLELTRITLPPGGRVDPEDHPGAAVMFVERGAVEITVEQGDFLLFRRAAGERGPVASPTPCSSPCRVEAGWSAVQGDFTRHNLVDVSGAGSVVLVSQFTADPTPGMATPAAGTPEAGTPAAAPGLGRPITTYGCDGGCR